MLEVVAVVVVDVEGPVEDVGFGLVLRKGIAGACCCGGDAEVGGSLGVAGNDTDRGGGVAKRDAVGRGTIEPPLPELRNGGDAVDVGDDKRLFL